MVDVDQVEKGRMVDADHEKGRMVDGRQPFPSRPENMDDVVLAAHVVCMLRNYSGTEAQYFLFSALAVYSEFAFFMLSGALFHILVEFS